MNAILGVCLIGCGVGLLFCAVGLFRLTIFIWKEEL